jgi:antitoxin (DNA-binding transcriptional repressor) of toxin-antitoxin stability system
MAQLTHNQYDALERAVLRGSRVAILRRGRPESVIVPLSLRLRDGREAIDARHPTTGHAMVVYLDEIDGIEVVG